MQGLTNKIQYLEYLLLINILNIEFCHYANFPEVEAITKDAYVKI